MKRSVELAPLSREHHAALALAKQARRYGAVDAANAEDDAATRSFMDNLVETFARELEPHFRIEESILLPALRDVLDVAGVQEAGAVQRTLYEHAQLRALSDRIGRYEIAALRSFGEAMEAHVRFEERELFPLVESVLSAGVLATIASAIRIQAGHFKENEI